MESDDSLTLRGLRLMATIVQALAALRCGRCVLEHAWKISFVSYHTRSISMNITRAEAWQLHKAVNTAKGDLCRHRDRNPTGDA